MSEAVLIAIVGVIGAAVGASISAWVSSRRVPAEIKKLLAEARAAEAEANKAEAEAEHAKLDVKADQVNLLDLVWKKRLELAEGEIKVLKQQVSELTVALHDEKNRLAQTEARLAQAESRAAESEKRANEFRQEVIKVGEMYDKARRELEKLALIIQQLFEQVEKLGGKPEVDPSILARIADLSQGNHAR